MSRRKTRRKGRELCLISLRTVLNKPVEVETSTKGSVPEGWRGKERGEFRCPGERRVVVPEVDMVVRRGAALGLDIVEQRGAAPGLEMVVRRGAARGLDTVERRRAAPGLESRVARGVGAA